MKAVYLALIVTVVALAVAVPLRAYQVQVYISDAGPIAQGKWSSKAFPIVWQMNPVQAANVTGTRSQADVFTAAFAAWQSLTTASVSFAQGPNTDASIGHQIDNINTITTNTKPGDLTPGLLALTFPVVYGGPGTDMLGRTIDFAGQILEADILFNSSAAFTTNTTAVPGAVDLQTVATHEIGHLLGLDHATMLSSTMFWTVGSAVIYPRNLSTDDIAAISLLYPSSSFAQKGVISGTVRTTTNAPVYGAIVVAVNANGSPVASVVTDPNGAYTIQGLDPGSYTVYAQPLNGPITISNITSLGPVYPGSIVNTNFTARYR